MSCSDSIISEEYADFILEYYFYAQYIYPLEKEVCANFIENQYVTVYYPLSEIPPITIENHLYSSIPKLYTLLDTTSMEASGILPVINQPYLDTRGQEVIIGFIDTGIDYQSPLFREPSGNSRIVGIWDQTIPHTSPSDDVMPEVIPFGTAYTQAQINQALNAEDPRSVVPTTDDNGHGTFIAGIAGGSDIPEMDFTGAAPDCSIAMVKLKPAKKYLRDFYLVDEDAIAYQENDIMLGIKYLIMLGKAKKMPVAICISLGTNSGNHDGTSPLGEYLNSISGIPGIITVVAAGNETGYGHHYAGLLTADQDHEDVELRVAENDPGFTMEFWASGPELFSLGFISPTGETIARIPPLPAGGHRIKFTLEATVIYVDYTIPDLAIGNQLIFLRFVKPTPGIWKIRVFNSVLLSGIYNLWLPIHTFVNQDTVFLKPSPEITITEPGNARLPITTATYNHRNDSLYIHSSWGYTRLGNIKPDITAPGVSVKGPSANSQTSGFTTQTGSSVAAAHTVGACANLLSWALIKRNNITMNTAVAKTYLIRGANRSSAYRYPNREWGFGTLNLYNSFLQFRE